MRLLDRYIVWSVVRATALAMLVLLVLMALFLFVNEQGWVGVGRYGNLQAARHVLFMLPVTLLPFLPVAALFGALLAIGQLARGSELTVMRASGISVRRIATAVFASGVLLLPIAFAMGEWLAPPLARTARETRATLRDGAISLTPQGVWLRDGDHILRAQSGAGGAVTLFELGPDRSLAVAARAASARGTAGGGWQLDDVVGTRLGGSAVVPWRTSTAQLELISGADFFAVAASEPDELSLTGLARAIDYRVANGLDVRRQQFAFWAGIARLVALPLAMLLAVPLIAGWLRGAETAARATAGLMLGLVWYIGQRMVESGALAFDLSPPLMAFVPTLLLGAALLWLLARMPRISSA